MGSCDDAEALAGGQRAASTPSPKVAAAPAASQRNAHKARVCFCSRADDRFVGEGDVGVARDMGLERAAPTSPSPGQSVTRCANYLIPIVFPVVLSPFLKYCGDWLPGPG
jgi:hypothetical protein